MARTGKVILAKGIKLDREHNNTLYIDEDKMVELMLLDSHKVYETQNCSFINSKNENSINLNIDYATALKANYIAYQNPNYSNKWFFAFIDSVDLLGTGSIKINYTIDTFNTWWEYWTANNCYVIREHVSNDSVGAHTIPEGLETGEYINNSVSTPLNLNNYTLVLATTSVLEVKQDSQGRSYLDVAGNLVGIGKYNGIYGAVAYYVTPYQDTMGEAIRAIVKAEKSDSITGLFLYPSALVTVSDGSKLAPYDLWAVVSSNSPYTVADTLSKQTTLNGYSPRNKKLLCYPYNFLAISNGGGSSVIYNYEDMSGTNFEYTIDGCLTPGGSIRLTPRNYKGISYNFDEGLNLAKFPICSYPVDMYTNWLTQNSINIAGTQITADDVAMGRGLASMIGAAATGNVAGFTGATIDTFSSIAQTQQHLKMPSVARGNLNGGDVIAAGGDLKYWFYKKSIKQEAAKIIDDFFDKYGYKVNRLKMPNFATSSTRRPHWNYTQIASGEQIGYINNKDNIDVPPQAMAEINAIFERGTTLWYHHNEIGNWSLDNKIS